LIEYVGPGWELQVKKSPEPGMLRWELLPGWESDMISQSKVHEPVWLLGQGSCFIAASPGP